MHKNNFVPENNNIHSKLTCVSGYWEIKNKHGNSFNEWFKNTLKINCPYIFFGDKKTIELVKYHRYMLPTYYIEININEFKTYKYKEKMFTDPYHCPSAELNLVWNEKLFFIQKASEINPFSSEFFCWVDAGIPLYRDVPPPSKPFPNLEKLNNFPKDKFIYSTSETETFNKDIFNKNKMFNHHVSGCYILHKNIINKFVSIYSKYLNLYKNNIPTDQIILTSIYEDHKKLFYKCCHGYGNIIKYLFY